MAVQPGTAISVRDQIYSLVASESGSLSPETNLEASFAELGFDSLGLMRLTELIEQRYGLVVSFRSLMEELSTARQLAEYVAAHAVSLPGLSPVTSQKIPEEHAFALRPAVAAPHTWSVRQAEYVEKFISRLLARTSGSQTMSEQAERVSGTPAVVVPGFGWLSPLRCPVVSPVESCRLRDVDGNEYVDLSMGSGTLLFGHGAFAGDALARQIAKGFALGPQPEVVGPVAEQICELTSVERVTFCNSGTEAIMAALRIARTVTRRNRIVMFREAEHGNFDGTNPGSPGVAPGIAAEVLVLEYGAGASLDVIRREGSTLAAVLVEPVQARQPQIQPREFLHSLRDITERYGTALIFDEVTTGFRCHPGGAQAWFGVRADLVTYGKALGGGMPIGVVAGAARFMDAIDGGSWSFDDDSEPYATQTFFAGTFCKHPLTMATIAAFLDRLSREGQTALTALNERTARLATRANNALQRCGAPIRVRHFSSWFVFEGDAALVDLFRHHLLLEGVFVWGDGPCFLSISHGDDELDAVIHAVDKSATALRDAGFFADVNKRAHAVSAGQREIWTISQFGAEASAAFNEPATLRLRGSLDAEALQRAMQMLVDRHEALRTTFSGDGELRMVHDAMTIPLPIHTAGDNEVASAIQQRIAEPFDLETGPLVRTELFRQSAEDHVLLVVLHHLITDGISMGLLLEELPTAYAATVHCVHWEPRAPESKLDEDGNVPDARDEDYWAKHLADPPPPLALPIDFVRPPVRTFRGGRVRQQLHSISAADLRALAGEWNATPFITLLSAYSILLHHLCRQPDLIVGCAASAPSRRAADVGFFVALLPIRSRIRGDLTYGSHLEAMRELVLSMQEHSHVSLESLARRLGLKPKPGHPALIATTFAVERPSPTLLLPGLTATVDTPETGFSKYDLTLNVDDLSLTCDWTFNTNLLRPATVERWAAQFDALLARVAADPNTRMDELADVLNQAAEKASAARARDEQSELRKLKRR